MIYPGRILFILLIAAICCGSCNQRNFKPHYSLKILLDTASNFYPDTVSISSCFRPDPYSGRYTCEPDTTCKTLVYRYDSVESGPLTILIRSLLNRSFSKNILLTNDTTIFISHTEIPSFETGNAAQMDFASLKSGEEICISVITSGCFEYSTEKTIIQSQGNTFAARYSSDRYLPGTDKPIYINKVLPAAFKDSLLSFQNSLLRFAKANKVGLCTTSVIYLIQKENVVYSIVDATCGEGVDFFKISRMINPALYEPTENN